MYIYNLLLGLLEKVILEHSRCSLYSYKGKDCVINFEAKKVLRR
jgi:hypothetical protein